MSINNRRRLRARLERVTSAIAKAGPKRDRVPFDIDPAVGHEFALETIRLLTLLEEVSAQKRAVANPTYQPLPEWRRSLSGGGILSAPPSVGSQRPDVPQGRDRWSPKFQTGMECWATLERWVRTSSQNRSL